MREPGRRIAHRTIEVPNSSAPPVSPNPPVTAAVRQSWDETEDFIVGAVGESQSLLSAAADAGTHLAKLKGILEAETWPTGSGATVRKRSLVASCAHDWQPAIQEQLGTAMMNPGRPENRPPHCTAQMGSVRLPQEGSGYCAHNLKTVVRKDLWVRVPRPPPRASATNCQVSGLRGAQ